MRITIASLLLVLVAGTSAAQGYPPIPEPGETFIAPLATSALLLDGTSADGLLAVTGAHGIVLISTDAGRTWSQAQTGTRTMLTGIYFHDRNNGWVVGHDALILRTTDGGASFEKVYNEPEDQRPLFDVWFADARRGIAIGAYGLYLSTEDGGASWQSRELIPRPWAAESEPADDGQREGEDIDEGGDGEDFEFEDDVYYDFHLNDITAAPNGDLYIAAEGGNFFRSRDSGATWYTMPTIYQGSFFKTLPLDGEQLLLMGMRGNLFHSADGGQQWSAIDLPVTALLNDGLRLGPDHLLLGGMAGTILESRDGGQSWTLHQQADRKAISRLLDTGDAIVVLGESGVQRLDLEQLRAGDGS